MIAQTAEDQPSPSSCIKMGCLTEGMLRQKNVLFHLHKGSRDKRL